MACWGRPEARIIEDEVFEKARKFFVEETMHSI